MTGIILSNGIKQLGGRLFVGCKKIYSIKIPSSVEIISSTCFQEVDNLTQINIDNKKDSISGAPWGSPYGMRVVNWLK